VSRALVFLLALVAHPAAAMRVTEVHYVMGTYFTITVDHADPVGARAAARRCFTEARRLEAVFSRFDSASELSQLNARSAESTPVSADMQALLRRAIGLQAATAGAFDPTVGGLTALWRNATVWPTARQVAAARPPGALRFDGATLLGRPDVSIDLDGIAKGWAVDVCVRELRAAGVTRAFLSLGESSLYAIGAPADAAAWPVAVRALDGAHVLGTLRLRDQAVSVSSVFGHEHRIGARRVGHIVDPRSGLPLSAPATAVVVAGSATDAEAFSKALLIAGTLPADPRVVGTLLIRPDGVRRGGRLAFEAFQRPRRIDAAAEPLR